MPEPKSTSAIPFLGSAVTPINPAHSVSALVEATVVRSTAKAAALGGPETHRHLPEHLRRDIGVAPEAGPGASHKTK